ncbi:MAG: hypothetical protein AMXMBFR13_17910 [Phycisphaerae bacterium]
MNVLVITLAILPTSGAVLVRPEPADRFPQMATEDEVRHGITATLLGRTDALGPDACSASRNADRDRSAGRPPDVVAQGHSPIGDGLRGGSQGLETTKLSSGNEWLPILGRLHPAIVFLAIAGVPLAWYGFAIWTTTGQEAYAKADVVPLFAATVTTALAVATGSLAHGSTRFSSSVQYVVEIQQAAVAMLMVVLLFLIVVRLRGWHDLTGLWKWAYAGGLTMALALVGVTGYLEGSLLLGPDHLGW